MTDFFFFAFPQSIHAGTVTMYWLLLCKYLTLYNGVVRYSRTKQFNFKIVKWYQ